LPSVCLGSGTGGSIRGPAALWGIVGLKPTYGLVSRAVYANSFTFDHAGPMTWTVEDCAIMLQAIAGPDPKGSSASANRPIPHHWAALTGDVRGLRIGIARHLTRTTLPRLRRFIAWVRRKPPGFWVRTRRAR
jgi:aspartyl-tRNA(Asn)/glutamyl-tRNA(Gln) amidotransferase subunit A